MKLDLSPAQVRVLCTLMEKAETTPDQYPLSGSALRTACNQKTSREPVTDYSEQEVDAVILSLRDRSLARSLRPSGSRGWKHRHCIDEVLALTMAEQAVLTVLGLRGPQSAGELRQRTSRIHEFESNEDVDVTLAELAARPEPLVRNTGRESGQSQDRWIHCLSDEAQSPTQGRQRVRAAEFTTLHESGFFAMPNPWDRASATTMESLGAKALATSSAAFGVALGKDDYDITRDELVAHVEDLISHIGVPLSVDGEQLFADAPGGIGETVAMLASVGAAGVSIEDYDPKTGQILDLDTASRAVEEAVAACRNHHVLLTARCENYLYGKTSIDDVIHRLQRYVELGAECVYAPGVVDSFEIGRIVEEVGAPVNVLALPNAPGNAELASLGVRRSSAGSTIFNNMARAMVETTRNFLGTDQT